MRDSRPFIGLNETASKIDNGSPVWWHRSSSVSIKGLVVGLP